MTLEDFIRPTQELLFKRLLKIFEGNCLALEDGYILVPGEAPVLLVAHLDTVHKAPVRQICRSESGNILMSPQGIGGDDRCGVYALIKVYESAVQKPWLLFTCYEETGGVGARLFCEDYEKKMLPNGLNELKLIIEIDRKGKDEAVYYDCANTDLEAYITSKGFRTEMGTFSDISIIAPALEVAAVNLSAGYYHAHTLHEYINCEHLNGVIRRVAEIVSEASKPEFPRYEYIDSFGCDPWDYGFDFDDMNEEYLALLDIYDPDILNAYIAEYGEEAVHWLYREEFGKLENL